MDMGVRVLVCLHCVECLANVRKLLLPVLSVGHNTGNGCVRGVRRDPGAPVGVSRYRNCTVRRGVIHIVQVPYNPCQRVDNVVLG